MSRDSRCLWSRAEVAVDGRLDMLNKRYSEGEMWMRETLVRRSLLYITTSSPGSDGKTSGIWKQTKAVLRRNHLIFFERNMHVVELG